MFFDSVPNIKNKMLICGKIKILRPVDILPFSHNASLQGQHAAANNNPPWPAGGHWVLSCSGWSSWCVTVGLNTCWRRPASWPAGSITVWYQRCRRPAGCRGDRGRPMLVELQLCPASLHQVAKREDWLRHPTEERQTESFAGKFLFPDSETCDYSGKNICLVQYRGTARTHHAISTGWQK